MTVTSLDALADVSIAITPMNSFLAFNDLMWTPVLRKFPKMIIALPEGGIGWIPYALERMDYTYSHHARRGWSLRRRWFLKADGVMDQWDPAFAARLVEQHGTTTTAGAPFYLASLMDEAERQGIALTTMRNYIVGAASVPASLVERADALGIPVYRAHGSSEHPVITTGTPADPIGKRAGTDGRLTPGNEIRLLDDDDNEVEDLHMLHPAVADAAAVGQPDLRLGERVAVFVQLRPGATIDLPELRSSAISPPSASPAKRPPSTSNSSPNSPAPSPAKSAKSNSATDREPAERLGGPEQPTRAVL